MITEEDKEHLNEQSMIMILHAGDAREKIMEALDLVTEDEFEKAEELITAAKKNLNESHKIQTMIVQKEAKEKPYYYSMLFSHAQDTLMTIQSEYNITRKLIKIVKKIEDSK